LSNTCFWRVKAAPAYEGVLTGSNQLILHDLNFLKKASFVETEFALIKQNPQVRAFFSGFSNYNPLHPNKKIPSSRLFNSVMINIFEKKIRLS